MFLLYFQSSIQFLQIPQHPKTLTYKPHSQCIPQSASVWCWGGACGLGWCGYFSSRKKDFICNNSPGWWKLLHKIETRFYIPSKNENSNNKKKRKTNWFVTHLVQVEKWEDLRWPQAGFVRGWQLSRSSMQRHTRLSRCASRTRTWCIQCLDMHATVRAFVYKCEERPTRELAALQRWLAPLCEEL